MISKGQKQEIIDAGKRAWDSYSEHHSTDAYTVKIHVDVYEGLTASGQEKKEYMLIFEPQEIAEAQQFKALREDLRIKSLRALKLSDPNTHSLVLDSLKVKFVGYFEKSVI